MRTLRTKDSEERYIEVMQTRTGDEGCLFCTPSRQTVLAEFEHFRIIKNDFPYDEVAEIHHMIYPKRHTLGKDMTEEEKAELQLLKDTYCKEKGYQYILEGITRLSIPSHVHFHLLTLKDK
jgi:diadenosine tetraphosphate (Ap4A) HIT family hydrolase